MASGLILESNSGNLTSDDAALENVIASASSSLANASLVQQPISWAVGLRVEARDFKDTWYVT